MSSLDQNTIYVAIIIAFLGFMIGLAKGGFGGFGALLTPILSLVLPVASAVGVPVVMRRVNLEGEYHDKQSANDHHLRK